MRYGLGDVRNKILVLRGKVMSRTVSFDCDGNDITCMKVFDALKYPCSACDIEDCPDRETYDVDEEGVKLYESCD